MHESLRNGNNPIYWVLEDGGFVADTSSMKSWVPIGDSDGVHEQKYTGTFDGGGYTISGLYFGDTSIGNVGLF